MHVGLVIVTSRAIKVEIQGGKETECLALGAGRGGAGRGGAGLSKSPLAPPRLLEFEHRFEHCFIALFAVGTILFFD